MTASFLTTPSLGSNLLMFCMQSRGALLEPRSPPTRTPEVSVSPWPNIIITSCSLWCSAIRACSRTVLRNLSRRSFLATTRKFPAEEISSNNCVSKTTRLYPWGSPCAYSVYFRTKSSGL
ncbi:hypothetical protein BDV32DRAFT_119148 [Aspergillus pseudonomiae]|uniref:Uncharacterized protein n=1 Tax=Aspergillus pseudonomiae TaxID=1506151 RepID=A0A5N6IE05_9EURO|nr:uncharacterized protein BDV37DRAFT_235175 [Aspergillus pseudonomiae]KAB8263293.1 hypothetical protein BDV32DRAFT_119148 [Aspergillus pseudonomiae]KAE8409834.1 hypothetical protein BDV37DRAFT_235175 [Aspergillus pseudonomiae]